MSKVTTKRQANGTYAYVLDGVVTPTEARSSVGARVQGLRMAAWVADFSKRTRVGYQSSDVTLEG